ncbi:MAG TPA: DUF427 domain-containing protein, partial [Burkholderiales bacterium]|nr:DUF427 domain-containing protein [Burkholderiales bacterium]
MRRTELSFAQLALVAGTRGMLGAGLALLLGGRLRRSQRKTVGWTLATIGALSTLPLAYVVLSQRKQGPGAGPSPGHRQWPAHKIAERPLGQRVQVWAAGRLVADSQDVLRVDEDDHPVRYYFPRSGVKTSMLERSLTTTQCPFKGTARYFHLRLDRGKLRDAVWSYEAPYDEHLGLKDRLAFYDER